jgi:hypothetical protein
MSWGKVHDRLPCNLSHPEIELLAHTGSILRTRCASRPPFAFMPARRRSHCHGYPRPHGVARAPPGLAEFSGSPAACRSHAAYSHRTGILPGPVAPARLISPMVVPLVTYCGLLGRTRPRQLQQPPATRDQFTSHDTLPSTPYRSHQCMRPH